MQQNFLNLMDPLISGQFPKAPDILQLKINYKESCSNQSNFNPHFKENYKILSSDSEAQTECLADEDSKPKPKQERVDEPDGKPAKEETDFPDPEVTLYSGSEINSSRSNSWPVGAGMLNVGNTCYLNSTLQALFHIPALVNWLLNDPHHNSPCDQNGSSDLCLTCAVARTLQHSHKSPIIKPSFIYNRLQQICKTLRIGAQEDAHEFLRLLLEGMEKAYLARHRSVKLDNLSKETTPINQIFGGYLRSEVRCLDCYHSSVTYQHFQDLLLDVATVSSLEEAIVNYFSREHLESKDYRCEGCKQKVFATKQFSIKRPPKVLCIQLKRFSVTGGKISRYIKFKPEINLTPYIHQSPEEEKTEFNYKLTSIITHIGSSVNSGHYTAVAQASSGKYYSFDDVYVRQIGLNNLLNTNPYIMIYEMVGESSNKAFQNKSDGIGQNSVDREKELYLRKKKFEKSKKLNGSSCNPAIIKTTIHRDNHNRYAEIKKLKDRAASFYGSNISNHKAKKFVDKKFFVPYESGKFMNPGRKHFNNIKNESCF